MPSTLATAFAAPLFSGAGSAGPAATQTAASSSAPSAAKVCIAFIVYVFSKVLKGRSPLIVTRSPLRVSGW